MNKNVSDAIVRGSILVNDEAFNNNVDFYLEKYKTNDYCKRKLNLQIPDKKRLSNRNVRKTTRRLKDNIQKSIQIVTPIEYHLDSYKQFNRLLNPKFRIGFIYKIFYYFTKWYYDLKNYLYPKKKYFGYQNLADMMIKTGGLPYSYDFGTQCLVEDYIKLERIFKENNKENE